MKPDGKGKINRARKSSGNSRPLKRKSINQARKRVLLGRYIVADPAICHGKPTFRGTRIMVWQVLEMLARGMAWESISDEFGGRVTKEAIAEVVQLAGKSFVKHAREHSLESLAA